MAVDVAHASTSACGTFASRCGLWLRAAWRIGQACKGRKQGRKEGWEQRLKSVECLSAGCLGASVCYISCSHFEFFKWLLGPAYIQTHIHTSSVYLTDTQSERGTYWLASSNQRHVDVQFSRCWFVSQDFCPRSQPPFASPPPRTRLVLACQLRNLFVTHFCSALFTFFWFAFFAVVCFSCSLLSGVRLFHLGRKTQTCLLVIYGAEFSFTWHFYGVVSGCFAVFASYPVVHVYGRFICGTDFSSSS